VGPLGGEVQAARGRGHPRTGRGADPPLQRAGRHPREPRDGPPRQRRFRPVRRRPPLPVRPRDGDAGAAVPVEGHRDDVRSPRRAHGADHRAPASGKGLQGRGLVGQRLPPRVEQQAADPGAGRPQGPQAPDPAHQGPHRLLPRAGRLAGADGLGRGVPRPAARGRGRTGEPPGCRVLREAARGPEVLLADPARERGGQRPDERGELGQAARGTCRPRS